MTSAETTTGLHAELVGHSSDLWTANASHPWVRALAAGTLPEPALITWAQQCRLFCLLEGQALTHLRQLQPPPGLDNLLARLENDACEREPAELTETLIAHGARPTSAALPVCQQYGTYVQDCASAGLLDGLGAVFAVEASYHDTWRAVRPLVPADSPWREWVENWSGPEFGALVTGLGQCLDDLAGDPPQPVRDRLTAIVRGVAAWELRFWDMCWTGDGQVRQETQP